MALTRMDIALDCNDLDRMAAFWQAALGYELHGAGGQYRGYTPPAGSPLPKLVLQQVPEPPAAIKNRVHLDLIVGADYEAEATRLEQLGATRLGDVVREQGTAWIVMTDPEGNEFCVCEA